jgi:hypothetical protein
VAAGETLFAAGDTDAAFLRPSKEGAVTLSSIARAASRASLPEHGPGEFTGDTTVHHRPA